MSIISTIKNDIALVAPSGTGKSTVNKALLLAEPEKLSSSISATTREPRGEEKNGKDYFFIPREGFFELARNRAFLEYNLYGSTYYGTLKHCVDTIVNSGKSVVYDVDINGAVALRNVSPRVKIFFLRAPIDVIKSRLEKRGTETPQEIKRRLEIAEAEFKRMYEADHIIDYGVNAVADLIANEILDLIQKVPN